VEDSAGTKDPPTRAQRKQLPHRFDPLRSDMRVGGQVQQLTIISSNDTMGRGTKTQGALCDRLENRMDIGWRAGDHAEDLTRRRLLLQRHRYLRMGLREGCVLVLQLREQADVLNCDHRLVGEGLEEWKLLGRKCASLLPDEREHTDAGVLTEHRNHK